MADSHDLDNIYWTWLLQTIWSEISKRTDKNTTVKPIRYNAQNLTIYLFLVSIAVVFTQSIEARC